MKRAKQALARWLMKLFAITEVPMKSQRIRSWPVKIEPPCQCESCVEHRKQMGNYR